jgi:hypothetical protein
LIGGSSPPRGPSWLHRSSNEGPQNELTNRHGSLEENSQRTTDWLKAITHDLFSVGVGVYLLSRVDGLSNLPYLILIVWLALATNEVIDVLGHFTRGGTPVRSFWTHSIFTAPVWGIVVAIPSVYLLDRIIGQGVTPSQSFVSGLGALLAYSHLLLDAITEGGVYLVRRRVALAHLRYNNPIINGAFAALGLLLVFTTFF